MQHNDSESYILTVPYHIIWQEVAVIGPLISSYSESGESRPVDFDGLYKEYHNKVYRHLIYLTGNVHAAEDIAQEVFTKLFNNPPGHANIAAWLFKVANNLAYNYLRSEKTRSAKEPSVLAEDEEKVISIEDIAVRNQEIREIKKILGLLSERDRMCLLLKFSGYKYNEIAEVIGVEKTSVGTILARSQAKFMEKFMKEV